MESGWLVFFLFGLVLVWVLVGVFYWFCLFRFVLFLSLLYCFIFGFAFLEKLVKL